MTASGFKVDSCPTIYISSGARDGAVSRENRIGGERAVVVDPGFATLAAVGAGIGIAHVIGHDEENVRALAAALVGCRAPEAGRHHRSDQPASSTHVDRQSGARD